MDMQEFNLPIIEEFRANSGKVGGQFAGMPLLLLTTLGSKSGRSRTCPLAYTEDNGRYIVIASFAGAPTDPPWFHNVVVNPDVGVEIGSQGFRARAQVVPEPERSALYEKMAAMMPAFADYARKTTRKIPVVALTRS